MARALNSGEKSENNSTTGIVMPSDFVALAHELNEYRVRPREA
jgi:hypothetical protein